MILCKDTPEGQWCYDIERIGAENIDNSRCLEGKEILGIHRQGETDVDTCENSILIDDSSFCPGGLIILNHLHVKLIVIDI